jgi:hypothetical protein
MPEPKLAPDPGEAESQDYGFLGRELLTWLLWRVDRGESTFTDDDGDLSIAFGGRARLLGVGADVTDAVLKGRSPAHGVETRAGIGAGRTLREAELRLTRGDREFRFTLIGDTLDLRGVKLPARLKGETDDRLGERMELLAELEKSIRTIYLEFIRDRIRPVWARTVVPAIRAWLAEGLAMDGR